MNVHLFGTSITIYMALMVFFIYGFLGWISEVAYQTIRQKRFVNRGFLTGMICPIYGVGMLLVLLVIDNFKNNWILIFIVSILLTTAIEFITGLVMKLIFHRQWWDYSDRKFNILGYICLEFSLMWGVGCTALVALHQFAIINLINGLPTSFGKIVLYILMIILFIDFVVSIYDSAKFAKSLKIIEKLQVKLRVPSDFVGEKVYESVDKAFDAYEKLREKILKKRISVSYPRLINAIKDKLTKDKKDDN